MFVSADVLRERLLVALELFEAGVDMMRQQLRRTYPNESEAQIERRMTQWLHHRPGAEPSTAIPRGVSEAGQGRRRLATIGPVPGRDRSRHARARGSDDDIELARESVRLIARRGCDRGRDLVAALEQALVPHSTED
jgi:Rv0078B-related antitoxin